MFSRFKFLSSLTSQCYEGESYNESLKQKTNEDSRMRANTRAWAKAKANLKSLQILLVVHFLEFF